MNALVMYDHQTRSLWSQFLGQSVRGEYTGTKLEFVPALVTDWATWAELHPERVERMFLLCPGFDLPSRWPLLGRVYDAAYRVFARNRLRWTGREHAACESDRCSVA